MAIPGHKPRIFSTISDTGNADKRHGAYRRAGHCRCGKQKGGGRIALAPSPALRAVVLGREDGTKVVLEEMPKVEDVVQTNVIAVVKPVQRSNKKPGHPGSPRTQQGRRSPRNASTRKMKFQWAGGSRLGRGA
jgi:hypothetical protein